jgi:hypothetical protein
MLISCQVKAQNSADERHLIHQLDLCSVNYIVLTVGEVFHSYPYLVIFDPDQYIIPTNKIDQAEMGILNVMDSQKS